MVSALDGLNRLRDGNRRFAANQPAHGEDAESRREELTRGQEPFAIILGCSDSRVPAEIIFDQGLGDLFVIRVAGNIVAPSQIGSVEFAATRFGTRLVVVLGHSQCGAIEETVDQLRSPTEENSRNIGAIVNFVRPSVEAVMDSSLDLGELTARAVRENVRTSAEQMRHGSEIIERLERDEGLVIVGAEYSLETGLVDFFDGVPQ
jgi:carbonic anhydrase